MRDKRTSSQDVEMRDFNGNARQRLVLFTPLNAAGHMQSSVAIADKLRADYKYRCVFLIAGPPHSNLIEDHGHELVMLDDPSPMMDFEIESDDDLDDVAAWEEAKRRAGKSKRHFEGSKIWAQYIGRNKRMFQREGKETARAMAQLIDFITKWLMDVNDALADEIERIQPDLIVADTVLPQPGVLRAQQARPWVRIYTPNPFNVIRSKLPGGERPPGYQGWQCFSRAERDRLRAEEPERWRAILAEWREAFDFYQGLIREPLERIDKYYRARGYDPSNEFDLMCINSAHLNVRMYPEALDYDQDDDLFEYPPRWLRCDSLVRECSGQRERAECEMWAKQLDERKGQFKHVVYLSLGSIASGSLELMRRLVGFLEPRDDANDDDDESSNTLYIISKGSQGDRVKLNPKNMLGGNYLPQTFLLQRSHLAVIHGGNNGLTESLYYGKPVVVLPAFGDQHDNGQRVEDLALGRRLDLYKCTREQLLSAIRDTLADEALVERVRLVGEKMRARDELGKVTNLLRVLAEGGRLGPDLTPIECKPKLQDGPEQVASNGRDNILLGS